MKLSTIAIAALISTIFTTSSSAAVQGYLEAQGETTTVWVWKSKAAHNKGYDILQSGAYKSNPSLLNRLLACMVKPGTQAMATSVGIATHDIMITSGQHTGCKGNIPVEVFRRGKPKSAEKSSYTGRTFGGTITGVAPAKEAAVVPYFKFNTKTRMVNTNVNQLSNSYADAVSVYAAALKESVRIHNTGKYFAIKANTDASSFCENIRMLGQLSDNLIQQHAKKEPVVILMAGAASAGACKPIKGVNKAFSERGSMSIYALASNISDVHTKRLEQVGIQ